MSDSVSRGPGGHCHQALVARSRRPGYAGQEGKNPPTGRNELKKGLEALDALVF